MKTLTIVKGKGTKKETRSATRIMVYEHKHRNGKIYWMTVPINDKRS